jgi:hypothetical protein
MDQRVLIQPFSEQLRTGVVGNRLEHGAERTAGPRDEPWRVHPGRQGALTAPPSRAR